MFTAAAEPLYGAREARSIAEVLARELYGLSRLNVAVEPGAEVVLNEDNDAVLRQLAAGRPVQYIVGSAPFCGMEFGVDEGVLIPRPETEELVGWVCDDACGRDSLAILDVGTGSGAIAVALASKLPGSVVSAIDISDRALAKASANATANGVEVDFRKADVLSADMRADAGLTGRVFDLIVSNPPYIPDADMASMHANVTEHEPHLALFVPDDDPLVFYRAIADHGRTMLADDGLLYFEIYEHLGSQLCAMLEGLGYVDVELRKDINDRERMLRCRKK